MDLSSLLSSASSWKGKLALGLGVLLLILLVGLAGLWVGYRHGRSTATAEGDAKYAELEKVQADANRLASDTARKVLDAEVVRRDELEKSLSTALATIADQGLKITNRRISDASRSVVVVAGRCSFGPGWVQLWNEALGFGDGDPGRSAAAPGAVGAARAAQPADSGLLPAGH